MGVEREVIVYPGFVGTAIPLRAVRAENGQWTVEVVLDFTITVDDNRKLRVYRQISVRANDQIGRKRA
jgi:hypothetical protein